MTGRRVLAGILALHLALGVVYAWATPIFEAPDEGTHFAFVHWLATGHGLPVQVPAGEPQPWAQEGSQPPLYYALAARLVRPLDLRDFDETLVDYPLTRMGVPGTAHGVNRYRHSLAPPPLTGTALAVQLVRGLSLVLSLGTIGLTYALAMALFPEREWLALLAAALVAFNPMALFINASVNNDNLLMLLSTAALVLMVRLMQPRPPRRAWLAAGLGAILGLSALTKISGLVLWPVAALALLIGAYRQHVAKKGPAANHSLRRPSFVFRPLVNLLGLAALTFGLALVIGAGWYLRNYQLYGEWLGLNTMVAIAGPREPALGLFELLPAEWRGFVLSYWAVFGVFTILPARWVHLFYDGLMLVAAAGGLVALLRSPARPKLEALVLALFCALTLAGVIRWSLQTPASQGRLMFGAIAPLSIFLAAGILAAARPLLLLRAGRAWAKGLALTLMGALALVAMVIPVAYIAPRYAPPQALAEADLPAELRPVHALMADGIELVGYTASGEAVGPGEAVEVTLYWRALAPITGDYALALHLLGRHGAEVGKLDTWPGGGLAATSQWVPGTLLADTYYLPVATDADLPTVLSLDLYFWDDDPSQPLPRRALDGTPLPSVTFEVGRAVPAVAEGPAPEQAVKSQFEHGLQLLGYDVSANGAVYLTLHWKLEGAERVPGDYTVFMHVVDEQGVLIMEPADSPPLEGYWPTSAWVPGHAVADTRLLALPPNLHAGRYDVRVGFYDPATGVRLTVLQADGTPWPDNAVVLTGVVVR